jgi:hypothetical protein
MKKDFRTKNLLSGFALNPTFIELHDCVLLADTAAGSLPKAQPQSSEERYKTEYVLNRRDIWALFEIPPSEPSPRLLCEAGNTIQEIWESKLRVKFPNRKFMVYFQYALPSCEITFFQPSDRQTEAEAQAKADPSSGRVDWRQDQGGRT